MENTEKRPLMIGSIEANEKNITGEGPRRSGRLRKARKLFDEK